MLAVVLGYGSILFSKALPVPEFADDAAPERHHTNNENKADNYRDGLAQEVKRLYPGDVGQPSTDFADFVFERDNNDGPHDRSSQGSDAAHERH